MPDRAIVFDFDGVILDTETPLYLSWQEVFAAYDVDLDIEMFSTYIGGAVYFDLHRHLETLTDLTIDRRQVTADRRARYSELVAHSGLLPGVMDYLTEARRLGCAIGLASNSDIGWVGSNLEEQGLSDRFDVVRTRDDVVHAKPAPEIYLETLRALEVVPNNAIAIEDSASGVEAAKTAGLFTVAVPNPVTRFHSLDKADLILESLSDMPLDQLIEVALRGGCGPCHPESVDRSEADGSA